MAELTRLRAQDWRRLISGIHQGLTTRSAAADAHAQHDVAASLRSRQIRPRRVAVLGSNGGVGTTTVSALLASVVAGARDDRTLLLSLHSDASDAAIRLGLPTAPRVTEVMAGLREHGQILPTPVTRTGLRVLSAPPPGQSCLGAGLAPLLDVAAAAGHGTVVVDAGLASRIGNLAILAELFDTVILVCALATDALSTTHPVLTRWNTETAPGAARLIRLAVRTRPGTPGAIRAHDNRRPAPDTPGPALGHDPELARGRALDLSALSVRNMTTMLRLGADIMRRR